MSVAATNQPEPLADAISPRRPTPLSRQSRISSDDSIPIASIQPAVSSNPFLVHRRGGECLATPEDLYAAPAGLKTLCVLRQPPSGPLLALVCPWVTTGGGLDSELLARSRQ